MNIPGLFLSERKSVLKSKSGDYEKAMHTHF